jgi:1-deoxy-D-xylulose-5-phosphate reductoisomerase
LASAQSIEPQAPLPKASVRVRKVIILGSTGSIGTQAIDIISRNPERFQVVGLAAGTNREQALAQARALSLSESQVVFGASDAAALVRDVQADVVLNGITGSVGLEPTMAALESGATLALANKESLIVGGELVRAARKRTDQIVPVDSEHSALAQALLSGTHDEVAKLVVTASGGPFRGRTRESLRGVTPAQALAHPTWNMGLVVTTNSATLVNKGLELIEAHLLFDIPFDRIEVTVHAQSVVHSMVEFVDGSTMAQCSPPDMRLPIALGLDWPHRVPGAVPAIDWSLAHTWTFEPLDEDAFPAVRMAKEVGQRGSTFPAVFNAANEQAVHAFHAGALSFLAITDVIAEVLEHHEPEDMSLEAVLAAEKAARVHADVVIRRAS